MSWENINSNTDYLQVRTKIFFFQQQNSVFITRILNAKTVKPFFHLTLNSVRKIIKKCQKNIWFDQHQTNTLKYIISIHNNLFTNICVLCTLYTVSIYMDMQWETLSVSTCIVIYSGTFVLLFDIEHQQSVWETSNKTVYQNELQVLEMVHEKLPYT